MNNNKELGEKIVEYCKKYEGTDKYDAVMLAMAKGYELAEEDSIFANFENTKDFLSVDKKTAISANGEVFHIGAVVMHESEGNDMATITSFSLNEETMDVIAHTNLGTARICFIYNKPEEL